MPRSNRPGLRRVWGRGEGVGWGGGGARTKGLVSDSIEQFSAVVAFDDFHSWRSFRGPRTRDCCGQTTGSI